MVAWNLVPGYYFGDKWCVHVCVCVGASVCPSVCMDCCYLFVTPSCPCAAFMGQYQDKVKSYGPDNTEMLFYQHLLALPMFAAASTSLMEHARLWNDSTPANQAVATLFDVDDSSTTVLLGPLSGVPVMWLYVCCNVVSQFVCVRGVFMLQRASGALTMTLALTVRKFFSLFLSIWFFNNTFTQYHWAGALLAFAGVALYSVGKAGGAPSVPVEDKKRQ